MKQDTPKTKLGSDKKPYNDFNLSHTVTTTADFGSIQPLFCKMMLADSTISLNLSQFCRLAPLPCPTFGFPKLRTFHRFVPMVDVFPLFENLVSQLPYNNGTTTFIPTEIPTVYLSDITLFLTSCSGKSRLYNVTNGVATPSSQSKPNFTGDFYVYSNGQATAVLGHRVNGDVSLEGADMFYSVLDSTDDGAIFAAQFSRKQKRLRKILIGLGYQLNPSAKIKVSILPLLAFYKAYFDRFNIKRDKTWFSTTAYKLIEFIKINNITDVAANSTCWSLFTGFLYNELSECWYVNKSDYFTSHVDSTAISQTSATMQTINPAGQQNTTAAGNNMQPNTVIANGVLNKAQLDALYALTRDVNKNTVMGMDAITYLKVHGFGDSIFNRNSNDIGDQVTQLNITDVMNQAGTPSVDLGEYAGKGIGESDGEHFKFKANSVGFWITFCAVTPEGQFCQTIQHELFKRGRYDFYDGQFDALGFELTSQAEMVGESHAVRNFQSVTLPPSLGFIPRYMGDKVFFGKINGDINLRSTRDSFLPYTLDSYITPTDVVSEVDPRTGNTLVSFDELVLGTKPEVYRNIGKYEDSGNFNRIFNSQQGSIMEDTREDNFIIHNIFEVNYYAPMLGWAESFDTDENKANTIDVQHS